jgi:serralysin
VGGTGNDFYTVNAAGDVVTEGAGAGTDTVNASIDYTLGANLERLTLLGSASIDGTGNTLANLLTGNAGANRLSGGSGNDTLNGGAGNDTLLGGAGHDTYIVNSTGDVVTEASGGGTDVVQSSVNYTIGANVERLTLLGSAGIDGTGNALANVLIGNAGANTLRGGDGNDVLDGGLGNDALIGGAGNDTYTVNSGNDIVTETSASATEIDTVRSSVNFTLSANVERLTLTGTASVTGTGNQLANLLIGNAGNNLLKGSGGNDSINGGAGNDVVDGGAGNDDLTGGAGSDFFLFASALNGTTNVDNVVDFVSADDRFDLDNAIFQNSGVTFGSLGADGFRAGAAAADASDRVIYDSNTGSLFYDADGTGAGGQILFARVDAGTTVNASDFFIA